MNFFLLNQFDNDEKEGCRELMKFCNYICRIVNSNRTIDMEKFEKLLKATYLLALTVFPWCHVVPSLHRVWGHIAKKMRKMKNKGLVSLDVFY